MQLYPNEKTKSLFLYLDV